MMVIRIYVIVVLIMAYINNSRYISITFMRKLIYIIMFISHLMSVGKNKHVDKLNNIEYVDINHLPMDI